MKKIIGALILIFSLFFIWINWSMIVSITMLNGDTNNNVHSLYGGSTTVFKIFIFYSIIMLISGILIFLNIKAGNFVYLGILILFIGTPILFEYIDFINTIKLFFIPIILFILLVYIEKKESCKIEKK